MQTKTVNEVIRDMLINEGLPLHYYVPYLNRATTCLNHLSFDHNFGPNVKQMELDILSYDRATLPNDVINVVSVFGLLGDKMLPFTLNTDITNMYNLDGSNNKIPYVRTESDVEGGSIKQNTLIKLPTYGQESIRVFQNAGFSGKYEYNVDKTNSEIILGVGHGLTKVNIKYTSSSVSKSSANVIHPYAEPAIIAGVAYETAKNNGSPQSKVAVCRDNFYNEKRVLRARLNPLSATEIMNILFLN